MHLSIHDARRSVGSRERHRWREQRLRGGRGRSAGTPLQRGARVPLLSGALAITRGHGLARAPGSCARAPAPHGCCRTSRRNSSTFAFGRLAGPDRPQIRPRGVGGLAGRLGSQPTTCTGAVSTFGLDCDAHASSLNAVLPAYGTRHGACLRAGARFLLNPAYGGRCVSIGDALAAHVWQRDCAVVRCCLPCCIPTGAPPSSCARARPPTPTPAPAPTPCLHEHPPPRSRPRPHPHALPHLYPRPCPCPCPCLRPHTRTRTRVPMPPRPRPRPLPRPRPCPHTPNAVPNPPHTRNPHPAPRTPHPASRTSRPAPNTPTMPHPTPHTPHTTPHTPHPADLPTTAHHTTAHHPTARRPTAKCHWNLQLHRICGTVLYIYIDR